MSHIFFTDCRLPCFKLFWCYRRVYGAIESFFRFLQSYGSLWGYEIQWYYMAKGVYTNTKTSYKTKYKFMGLLKSTKLWESAMLLVHGATGDDNLHGYGSTELRESTKLREFVAKCDYGATWVYVLTTKLWLSVMITTVEFNWSWVWFSWRHKLGNHQKCVLAKKH